MESITETSINFRRNNKKQQFYRLLKLSEEENKLIGIMNYWQNIFKKEQK